MTATHSSLLVLVYTPKGNSQDDSQIKPFSFTGHLLENNPATRECEKIRAFPTEQCLLTSKQYPTMSLYTVLFDTQSGFSVSFYRHHLIVSPHRSSEVRTLERRTDVGLRPPLSLLLQSNECED